MKEEKELNGLKNEEIITVDETEDLISIAQRRVDTVQKLINISLQITTYRDWISVEGQPYLIHSGAEKIARLFGIKLENIKTEKVWAEDTKGKYYIYKTTGTALLPGKFDSIEALGTCSQRDKFFAFLSKTSEWKDTLQIDETNIMKASYSNFVVNAITHLLGLRNLTWDQLKEAKVDDSKIPKIEYEKGTQATEKTLSKESFELRQKIWKMCLELAAGSEDNAQTILERNSAFPGADKKEIKASNIKDLRSDKWIRSTYGRVKTEYEKTFGKGQGDLGLQGDSK